MLSGVYKDGVVIVDDSSGLRNGTRFELRPKPRTARTRIASKPAAETAPRAFGRGMWKNRPDLGKTPRQIGATLRKRLMGRGDRA